jgi:hypothetical protein
METKRLEVGWLKFAIFVKTQRTKEQKSIHFVWLSDFFSLFFVRKNLVLLPFRSDLGKCLQILRVSHNSQLNQFRKFEEFWIQFNFFFHLNPRPGADYCSDQGYFDSNPSDRFWADLKKISPIWLNTTVHVTFTTIYILPKRFLNRSVIKVLLGC